MDHTGDRPIRPMERIGRATRIIKYDGEEDNEWRIEVTRLLFPTEVNQQTKKTIPPLQHLHLQHMPEVVDTDEKIFIKANQILGFAFAFPASNVTSPDSDFHPQGMQHYYIIRFHYSYTTKE